MGMYTEIFVNVDFIKTTPQYVLDVVKAIVDGDYESHLLKDKPNRWSGLFCNMSYYTPNTCCSKLTYDNISKNWSLIGKGDIKNYDSEIEAFFKFISPWVDDDFMGYMRYEEYREPTLMYKTTEQGE